MYTVYDMKDNEQCIGIFEKQADIAKYFNMHKNSVSRIISKKRLIKNRYEIVKIKEEGVAND